jgi:hypothetical protein
MSMVGGFLRVVFVVVLVLWLQVAKRGDAALPVDLTNFQDEYCCDETTHLIRSRNVGDVVDAVKSFEYLKAVGEGHSW